MTTLQSGRRVCPPVSSQVLVREQQNSRDTPPQSCAACIERSRTSPRWCCRWCGPRDSRWCCSARSSRCSPCTGRSRPRTGASTGFHCTAPRRGRSGSGKAYTACRTTRSSFCPDIGRCSSRRAPGRWRRRTGSPSRRMTSRWAPSRSRRPPRTGGSRWRTRTRRTGSPSRRKTSRWAPSTSRTSLRTLEARRARGCDALGPRAGRRGRIRVAGGARLPAQPRARGATAATGRSVAGGGARGRAGARRARGRSAAHRAHVGDTLAGAEVVAGGAGAGHALAARAGRCRRVRHGTGRAGAAAQPVPAVARDLAAGPVARGDTAGIVGARRAARAAARDRGVGEAGAPTAVVAHPADTGVRRRLAGLARRALRVERATRLALAVGEVAVAEPHARRLTAIRRRLAPRRRTHLVGAARLPARAAVTRIARRVDTLRAAEPPAVRAGGSGAARRPRPARRRRRARPRRRRFRPGHRRFRRTHPRCLAYGSSRRRTPQSRSRRCKRRPEGRTRRRRCPAGRRRVYRSIRRRWPARSASRRRRTTRRRSKLPPAPAANSTPSGMQSTLFGPDRA